MASTTVKTFRTTPRSLDCAEVFFKCLEVFAGDGYGKIADSIRGAVYNPLNANTGQFYDPETGDGAAGMPLFSTFWSANGSTTANSVNVLNDDTIPLESGSWPNFAQRKVIIFATGVFRLASVARVPFGNGATLVPGQDGNISISFSGRLHAVVRNENEGLLAAAADPEGMTGADLAGQFVTVIGEYVPATTDGVTVTNGSMHVKITDQLGNVHVADDAVTPLEMNLVADTVGDVRSDIRNVTRFGGIDFYSIMAFSFSGDLPPEAIRESAYKWMRAHHAQGHRELPPHFTGYS